MCCPQKMSQSPVPQALHKCTGTMEIWSTPAAISGAEVSGDSREGRPPQVTGEGLGLLWPLGTPWGRGSDRDPQGLGQDKSHPPGASLPTPPPLNTQAPP